MGHDINTYLKKYAKEHIGLENIPSNTIADTLKYMSENPGDSVEEAVSDWLDAHPEATTTVQDGSLTEPKFADSLKLKVIKDYVTPQMFGAVGDGVSDDTDAFVQAFMFKNILIPSGTYNITSVMTTEAFNVVGDDAHISYTGEKAGIIIQFNPDTCVNIDGININCNRKATKGISVSSEEKLSYISIKNCTITNTDNNDLTVSSCGIYVASRADHVNVENCTIDGIYRTTGSSGSIASIGIAVHNIDGTCSIKQNSISNVFYDNTVLTDADGIQAFSYSMDDGNIHDISVTISDNVITQCQGRFIKSQCDNILINNNTMINTDLTLITNFRGVDLQTGKGTVQNNRISIINEQATPSAALISCTGRSYTNRYVQFTAQGNELLNSVQGGCGILFIPYDMRTSVIVKANNFTNFNFGFDIANSGVSLSNILSFIVCENTFNDVYVAYRSREESEYIKPIVEHNYGYTFDNSEVQKATGKKSQYHVPLQL